MKLLASYHEQVKLITDAEAGKLFKALLAHMNGEATTFLGSDLVVALLHERIINDNKAKATRRAPTVQDRVPSYAEFKGYAVSKDPLIDFTDLKLKYDAWVENDWRDGHDQPIKRWKAKLCQTIPHMKKVTNRPGMQPQQDAEADKLDAKNKEFYEKQLAEIRKEQPDYDPSQAGKQYLDNFKKLQSQTHLLKK